MLETSHNRPLHIFASLTALVTLGLIFVGGLVTSTGSGLSVPDWPNTYGEFMFSFPFSDMVGGIFYEHGHRLFASAVGVLTAVLAAWLWLSEKRYWVKVLGLLALGAVILQGLLGGLTVLLLLPTPISVFHGTLAQSFFLMLIAIGYATSKEFIATDALATSSAEILRLRRLAAITTGVIYGQLVLGAVMRHTGSGLAFLDFPLTGGSALPTLNATFVESINYDRWVLELPPVSKGQMALHYLHRVGALLVAFTVSATTWRSWRLPMLPTSLKIMGLVLFGLLILQITLGAATILSLKQHIITSSHVVTGATILGFCFLFTLRVYKFAGQNTLAQLTDHTE